MEKERDGRREVKEEEKEGTNLCKGVGERTKRFLEEKKEENKVLKSL